VVIPADWKEVRLGEICELSLAASKKSRSDGRGKYIIADMGSVSKDGSFLTHKTTDVRDDVLRTGDLVMPKDDIGGGQIIGKAVLVDEDERYVLGDHVYRLRLSDGFPAFVRYGINSYKVNIQLRSKVVGSAQLGLGRRAVLEQPISFPPLKEQEAIAEALSVMDEELEALAEQVLKMRMVKEGMMQDLLSGKVRLV
jgi:type I restriction enzyme S subunit